MSSKNYVLKHIRMKKALAVKEKETEPKFNEKM